MKVPLFPLNHPHPAHFTLAYVAGYYCPPGCRASGRPPSPAFHLMRLALSEGTPCLSFVTVTVAGETQAYNNSENIDNIEYALLRAWQREEVPVHAWSLFPIRPDDATALDDTPELKTTYNALRQRLAVHLSKARFRVMMQRTSSGGKPMFLFDETDLPDPMADTKESQEITQHVLAFEE